MARNQAAERWLARQFVRIAGELDQAPLPGTDGLPRHTVALGKILALLPFGSTAGKQLSEAIAAPPEKRCECGRASDACVILRDSFGHCCAACSCDAKCEPALLRHNERREAAERARAVREDLKLDPDSTGAIEHVVLTHEQSNARALESLGAFTGALRRFQEGK